MDIIQKKYELSNVQSQLIIFNRNGKIKFSCNTIIQLKLYDDLTTQLNFLNNLWSEKEIFQTDDIIEVSCLNFHHLGQLYYIDLIIKPIKEDLILFINDRTKWYNQIQDLQQDRNIISMQEEELEILKKEQELFFSKVNHELRTPLNSIIGLSHLLRNDKVDELEKEQLTSSLIKSANHLKNIVNDILDLSKLDSLNMELHPKEHSISSLLHEIKQSFKFQLKQKQLELKITFSQVELENNFYLIDPVRFKQIFINIINNAINFSQNSRIHIECLINKIEHNSHKVSFSITDNGIGIPKDRLEHLFSNFSQVDSSSNQSNRESRGTGLGLAIVKQLIELHNGTISVKSKVDKGTTFQFELPIKTSSFQVKKSSNNNNNLLNGARCLIVEDDAMNRLVLEKLLNRFECSTDSCTSAEQAISLLKSKDFDFVITDYHMKGQDGLELKNNYTKLYPNSPTKWILISGTKFFLDDKNEISTIFDAYLIKPVCPNNLQNLLIDLSKKNPLSK